MGAVGAINFALLMPDLFTMAFAFGPLDFAFNQKSIHAVNTSDVDNWKSSWGRYPDKRLQRIYVTFGAQDHTVLLQMEDEVSLGGQKQIQEPSSYPSSSQQPHQPEKPLDWHNLVDVFTAVGVDKSPIYTEFHIFADLGHTTWHSAMDEMFDTVWGGKRNGGKDSQGFGRKDADNQHNQSGNESHGLDPNGKSSSDNTETHVAKQEQGNDKGKGKGKGA
jgi:hypothetical protein